MTRTIFITGTDTGIGKTFVSVKLLHHFNLNRCSTIGIKPIATGCNTYDGKLYNEDALQLIAAASIKLPYADVNPFAFSPAIAPHIASNNAISVHSLTRACKPALSYPADVCLIEGVGGWQVPLNSRETMADFVIQNQLDVILVVGIKLGCINHALLSAQSILGMKASIVGWIANMIDPDMMNAEENIQYLKSTLTIPLLGITSKDTAEFDSLVLGSVDNGFAQHRHIT